METQDVLCEIDSGVAWIRFNRPEVGNAARSETMRALCRLLDAVQEDPKVGAIVLCGAGRHFIAGADLKMLEVLGTMPVARIKDEVYGQFQGAARRLYHCPKPTIAAIRGAAVTVGCELALCCDFRIVGESAFFQEKWIAAGTIPPLGGLKLLPNLIGLGRAKDMVLRGAVVKADEAVRIGLAHQMTPDDDLELAAQALALELAGASPQAYEAAKAGLHRGLESGMEVEWQANVSAQAVLIGSDRFRESLSALKGSRGPLLGRRAAGASGE